MATRIYAYNAGSRSARNLAEALGSRVLRREGSTWRPRPGDTIINWGSSAVPYGVNVTVLNKPTDTAVAGNKLQFFRENAEAETPARVPDWTTDTDVARRWDTVVVRNTLTGHSGRGIVIIQPERENVPNAPLYTRYVKKHSEFRVHIVKGEVIDVQRKIRDPDREPTNWQVRSHDNGFIYVRTGFVTPDDVLLQARRAFDNSGLDFGAVDVIWNETGRQAYVLEINTAPGLEGTTVEKYAEAFRRII